MNRPVKPVVPVNPVNPVAPVDPVKPVSPVKPAYNIDSPQTPVSPSYAGIICLTLSYRTNLCSSMLQWCLNIETMHPSIPRLVHLLLL